MVSLRDYCTWYKQNLTWPSMPCSASRSYRCSFQGLYCFSWMMAPLSWTLCLSRKHCSTISRPGSQACSAACLRSVRGSRAVYAFRQQRKPLVQPQAVAAARTEQAAEQLCAGVKQRMSCCSCTSRPGCLTLAQ